MPDDSSRTTTPNGGPMAGSSGASGVEPDRLTPNRDRRREPPTIDLKAKEAGSPPARGFSARRWVIVPALVGLIAAAAVALPTIVLIRAYISQSEVSAAIERNVAALQDRLDALDAMAKTFASAADVAALDQRVAAAEAARGGAAGALGRRLDGIEKRLAAAEAAPGAAIEPLDRRISALETGGAALRSAMDAAAAKAEAARTESARATAALAAREPPQSAKLAAPLAELGLLEERTSRLESRLASLEAAWSAPKDEGRTSALPVEPPAAGAKDATLARAAHAIRRALDEGTPYAPDLAAADRLGANAETIAALRPFADTGAPMPRTLAAQFVALVQSGLAARSGEAQGFLGKLSAGAAGLVRVRPIGEAGGDDPATLVAHLEATLDRGAFDESLALWSKLPAGLQRASKEWADLLKMRAAAQAAAEELVSEAEGPQPKPKS